MSFTPQHHEDALPLEELRREIAIGLEQEARDEYETLDIEAIIAEGYRRLAEKLERK